MPQTPPRSIWLALRWLNSPLLSLACSMNRRFDAASASATMCSDIGSAPPPLLLRVFGRLPVSGVTRCSEAGVRKASGEETAGEFAPAVVSVYGDLACVCPDLWISNGDHDRVIIVALALVAACRIGTVVL